MRAERHRACARPGAAGGFTLLEILVALAVVAIALSALVSQASQSLDHTARLRERTLAHWVALNLVAERRLAPQWPRVGVERGSALMADREWFWLVTVSETADRNVRRLDVEVHGDARRQRALAHLIAYVGRPLP